MCELFWSDAFDVTSYLSLRSHHKSPLLFAWYFLYENVDKLLEFWDTRDFIQRHPFLEILVYGMWFVVLLQSYCRPDQNRVWHSVTLVVLNMVFRPVPGAWRPVLHFSGFSREWRVFLCQRLQLLASHFFSASYVVSHHKVYDFSEWYF